MDRLDASADSPKAGRLVVAVRPHDQVDARVGGPRPLDDEPRRMAIADRDDEHPRQPDAGVLEELRPRSVAVDRGDAAGAKLLDVPPVEADHDIAVAAAVEHRGDRPADPAVAGKDRVAPERLTRLGRWQPRQVDGPPLEERVESIVPPDERLERLDHPEQERVHRDRHEGAGDDELEAIGRQQREGQADGAEDERELADLGQAGCDRQAGSDRVAERRDDRDRHERLGNDDQADDGDDLERVLDEEARIEEHPDRDEEEHGERVTKRQRVGRGLVAHVGLANDRPGEERPEGQRDAEDRRGGERDPERDRQDRRG